MNVYLISGHLFLLCYWEKQSKKRMISHQKHQINQVTQQHLSLIKVRLLPKTLQRHLTSLELLPYYSRMVATLSTCMKDVPSILLLYLVMFYGLAVVTFGTAVPAGQFVPGIMIGSTYGHLVGMFVVRLYEKLNIEEGTYALLGAASFLGGSMRMAVSLCVIMVEIRNNLKLLPLIILVLLISKARS
ncbi:unnamed protein product [Lactuca saligna]|uniref:Chloride channel protein n=1 Tax=Lactuca saligna TaxID=75948 RepID=A0AA35Z510_LACSI|nr:unnamed protein product [Lactuca saligna]